MTEFMLTYMRVFLTKNTCARRRVNQNTHREKKNHLRLTWYLSGWPKIQFVRSLGEIRDVWLSHLILKINLGLHVVVKQGVPIHFYSLHLWLKNTCNQGENTMSACLENTRWSQGFRTTRLVRYRGKGRDSANTMLSLLSALLCENVGVFFFFFFFRENILKFAERLKQ